MSDRSNIWECILYPESMPEYWKDYIEDTKVPCILSPCHNFDVFSKYDQARAESSASDLILSNLKLSNQAEDCKALLQSYVSKKDSLSKLNNIKSVSSKLESIESEIEMNNAELDRLSQYVAGHTKKPHYHLIVNYGNGANKSLDQIREDFAFPLNGAKTPRIVKSERGAVRYLIHKDHKEKFQYRQDEIRVFNGYYFSDFFEVSNRELDNMTVEVLNLIEEFHIMSYSDAEKIFRVYRPYHKYLSGHTIFLSKIFEQTSKYSSPMSEKEIAELRQKLIDLTSP